MKFIVFICILTFFFSQTFANENNAIFFENKKIIFKYYKKEELPRDFKFENYKNVKLNYQNKLSNVEYVISTFLYRTFIKNEKILEILSKIYNFEDKIYLVEQKVFNTFLGYVSTYNILKKKIFINNEKDLIVVMPKKVLISTTTDFVDNTKEYKISFRNNNNIFISKYPNLIVHNNYLIFLIDTKELKKGFNEMILFLGKDYFSINEVNYFSYKEINKFNKNTEKDLLIAKNIFRLEQVAKKKIINHSGAGYDLFEIVYINNDLNLDRKKANQKIEQILEKKKQNFYTLYKEFIFHSLLVVSISFCIVYFLILFQKFKSFTPAVLIFIILLPNNLFLLNSLFLWLIYILIKSYKIN